MPTGQTQKWKQGQHSSSNPEKQIPLQQGKADPMHQPPSKEAGGIGMYP